MGKDNIFLIFHFLFLFFVGAIISYYGIYVSNDDWSYYIGSLGGALIGYAITSSIKLQFYFRKNDR